jgi:anti-sigma factor RsiW
MTIYLDGELPSRRKEAVESHLAQCSACRHLFEHVQSMVMMSAQLDRVQVSEEFNARLWEQILREEVAPVRWTRPLVVRRSWAWASAVMVILAIMLVSHGLRNQDTVPLMARIQEEVDVPEVYLLEETPVSEMASGREDYSIPAEVVMEDSVLYFLPASVGYATVSLVSY